MKTKRLVVFSFVALTMMTLSSFAEARVKNKTASTSTDEAPMKYSQSAMESTYTAATPGRFALGFSTIQSTIPGSTAAITGLIDLSHYDTIQAFFALPSTSPFSIGSAVLYKRTVSESRGAGFHVGGGFGFSNTNTVGGLGSTFALNFSAIGGFHFEMPGISHVMVHLDGGPTFALITAPNTSTNLQLGALSPALGASIVYIF